MTASSKPALPRPSDPFHGIPDPSADYEGTPLELRPAETEES